jgi:hypothetical protein
MTMYSNVHVQGLRLHEPRVSFVTEPAARSLVDYLDTVHNSPREVKMVWAGEISTPSPVQFCCTWWGWGSSCGSLDRESNPRPLAFGNTASIKGTSTLTTKPNPLLHKYKVQWPGSYVVPLNTLREIPWWTIPQLLYFHFSKVISQYTGRSRQNAVDRARRWHVLNHETCRVKAFM